MKIRFTTILIFLMAVVMLAGCAGAVRDQQAVEKKLEKIAEKKKIIETDEESADEPAPAEETDVVSEIDEETNEVIDEEISEEIYEEVDEEIEPYAGVLYWYKDLQDSGKTSEEMERYTSKTALVQHGWPFATNNDEVGYVYFDLTGDGYDELIITYYNDPVDIYSNEGDAVYSYGVPYRAIAELYPDGTIMEGLTLGVKGWKQTWYRYDENTYKYVPVEEDIQPAMSGIILPEGKKIKDVVVPESLKGLSE